MRFNITIAPFKAQNPLITGFLLFLNVGYTKPIVEKILPYFLKNANIMSPSSAKIIYLSPSSIALPRMLLPASTLLPVTNDVRIPLIPLIIGQVWYQFWT